MTLPPFRGQTLRVLPLTFLLTGCAGLMPIFAPDDVPKHDAAFVACNSFFPTTWSVRDTGQTIKEVKQHNAAYDALCPVKP